VIRHAEAAGAEALPGLNTLRTSTTLTPLAALSAQHRSSLTARHRIPAVHAHQSALRSAPSSRPFALSLSMSLAGAPQGKVRETAGAVAEGH
jgi:hypothetical protein